MYLKFDNNYDVINICVEVILNIYEYVSKYSTLSYYLKSLTTSLALYLST